MFPGNWLIRLLWAAVLTAAVAYWFRKEWRYERQVALTGCTARSDGKRSTEVWLSPLFFPLLLLCYWLLTMVLTGPGAARALLVRISLELVVLLSLFFGALLLLLPLLRRRISARACATLWLLPVFLYYSLYLMTHSYQPPLVVLRIPPVLAALLPWVWGTGCAGVLAWHLISHLHFRHALLRDARPVEDPAVTALWQEEQRLALRKRPLPLLTSPAVSSPLTVGLLPGAMRTLLPERAYTPEQYRLIFRHELRHVQRGDVDTKCFYALCMALCWFNPLVWLALRRAAADLELSCDEMVLWGAEDRTRREYASLLLETAGDGRGLTTCLSASAHSLRYRLRQVVQPRRRTSGTAVVALVMAALVLSFGLVGVSTSYGSMEEVLLAPYGTLSADYVRVSTGERSMELEDPSPAAGRALLDYLSALPVTRLTVGVEDLGSDGPGLRMFLSDFGLDLRLTDGYCSLTPLGGASRTHPPVLCRVDGPVDWEQLYALASGG